MKTKIQHPSFAIIGIEARTNNSTEMGPNGIISKQWDRFMKENLFEKIPHKSEDSVIAGYTEYESNKNGDYTFIIGAKVASVDVVPNGMVVKHVPAGNYIVFTSQKGPVWEVVQAIWKKIWNLSGSEAGNESTRTYKFDYEVYDKRAHDPSNSEVDVYLGIK
jgi:predicted transcriptional regulator YdeE